MTEQIPDVDPIKTAIAKLVVFYGREVSAYKIADQILALIKQEGYIDPNALADTKAQRALQEIYDISVDYDGYRSPPSLMELIDEIRTIASKGLAKKAVEV